MNVVLLNIYRKLILIIFRLHCKVILTKSENESLQIGHQRAVSDHSWHQAQTAGKAQAQGIYCSTEGRAQLAASRSAQSLEHRWEEAWCVWESVCCDRGGIDQWVLPSPSAASWPGQLSMCFASSKHDCVMTLHTSRANSLCNALAKLKRSNQSFVFNSIIWCIIIVKKSK